MMRVINFSQSFNFIKPPSENASAKMQYIYHCQVMGAKWRAAAEFDEFMMNQHKAEMAVSC